MLKEQAISLLTQVKEIVLGSKSWLDSVHQPIEEAFSMAIEAIKSTQHNTPNTLNALDTIYRQAAIDALEESKKTYFDRRVIIGKMQDILVNLPSAQPTLYGYSIEHLELIARVLQKEDLPPERIVETLTDIGRIVAIVKDEFEESLRKAVGQCTI